jgi:mono/diheme cytochrome c family protein
MSRIACIVSAVAVALAPVCGAAADKPAVDFVRDIRPIFAKRCYECHGEETRESGLRLDRKEPALEGGDSGKVIEPGKPDESILLELVKGDDPDRVMPPEGETLTDEQIELLTKWIKAGAPWPDAADKKD